MKLSVKYLGAQTVLVKNFLTQVLNILVLMFLEKKH